MNFQLQLKKLAYSNPNDVLKLTKIGVKFTHGKYSSHVNTLPTIAIYTMPDLLTLAEEYGKLCVEVVGNAPILHMDNL